MLRLARLTLMVSIATASIAPSLADAQSKSASMHTVQTSLEKILAVADANAAKPNTPKMQGRVIAILDKVRDPIALGRISSVSSDYGFPGAAEDASFDDAFNTAAEYAVVRLAQVGGCEAKNQLELLRASGKADGGYAESIGEALIRVKSSCHVRTPH